MDSDAGCPVGILIDLSEPAPVPTETDNTHQVENKENSAPETDAIEVTRKASQEDCHKLDIDDSLKQDSEGKKTGLHPQNSASDVRLIDDEVFDFDLPVSPDREGGRDQAGKRRDDDEEEVFFGPMGFTEKCIAAGVAEDAIHPLTPLRPDQMAELAKEAYSVAYRISLMDTGTGSDSVAVSPSKTLRSCRKNLAPLIRGDQEDHRQAASSSQSSRAAAPPGETASPKKRKHSEVLSKESSPESVLSDKGDERSDADSLRKKDPGEVGVLGCSRARRLGDKEQLAGTAGAAGRGSIPAARRQGGSKLQPPSKLRRFNNSQPSLLSKPKPAAVEESSEEQNGGGESSQPTAPVPMIKRSLQAPRAGGAGHSRQGGGRSGQESDHRGCAQDTAPPIRGVVRRAHSLNYKSGLPSGRGSKLAMLSNRSAAATSSAQRVGGESGGSEAAAPTSTTITATSNSSSMSISRKSSGIPKGPAPKPQLMQPGQLQRKTVGLGRVKGGAAAAPGPLKAHPPPPPPPSAQQASKPVMGQTVERPYNPTLVAASAVVVGNLQCPNTPAPQRNLAPRVLSLNSQASTPAKSSCSSSSACDSTPGSVSKRLSLLPTSAKRRSIAGSLPPPSPMSVGSSASSVSKQSLASSSDAADSPVFDPRMSSRLAKSRRISGAKGSCSSSDLDGTRTSPFAFKSRKALVQNTPELPQRTVSRWSPVRKPKAIPLEDQVSMCTKRVTPTSDP